tara:strand:- start:250 stop:720 length:471 start_codon:yes stop_codon:yes gene_type:complete
MVIKKIFFNGIILSSLLTIQSILSLFFSFIPDVIFIYLIIFSLYKNRTEAIVCGFLFGFFQDCLTQSDLLGINSLTKTFLTFFIGSIKFYNDIWSPIFKKIILALSIFFCYVIFYFIKDSGEIIVFNFFVSILSQTLLSIIIVLMINKYVLNNRLL